ncbi:hypothetical protein LSH36_1015g00006 [Paralvinella palmiformis]|uniref:beta-N-acetylhexosaminidase n=1 Tax=Paralvinella palmiformis TaxID=53620 RepID=A0AAD9IX24_9ANNE|nr:hypothetical protein LSH36_1015g00006 [Paralvinella palmiformis]
MLNYIATNVQVMLHVADGTNLVTTTMINTGSQSILPSTWYIVLCHSQSAMKQKHAHKVANNRLELDQLEGNIFTLRPTQWFKSFDTGERIKFMLGKATAGSDYFPNWYVTAPHLAPRVILSTVQNKLYLDYSGAVEKYFTPLTRFMQNIHTSVQKLDGRQVHVIPTPHSITYKAGQMGNLSFTFDGDRKLIRMTTGQVKTDRKLRDNVREQMYQIYFRQEHQIITIVGVSPVGVFYGIQTLLALISHNGQLITDLPEFNIVDYPRLPYRGLMVDTARSFVRKKEVIPEIDTPGHSHAAIVSMRSRSRKFQKLGDTVGAMKYALLDPEDKSVYKAVNDYVLTTINPCMNSTFFFLEHVILAIKEMHKDIQPLTAFHVGGDEVPGLALKRSPLCVLFKQQHPKITTTKHITQYFMMKVSDLLRNMNLSMQIWEDGVFNKDNPLTNTTYRSMQNIQAQIWKTGKRERIINLAKQGYKLILSEASHVYFDHKYEPHPEERGFTWARSHLSLKTIFQYSTVGEMTKLHPQLTKQIIGIEGALWGETIQTRSHFDSMLIRGRTAYVNTGLPGLRVDISVNRGSTWRMFNNGSKIPDGRLYFSTRSTDGTRRSRIVDIMHEAKGGI